MAAVEVSVIFGVVDVRQPSPYPTRVGAAAEAVDKALGRARTKIAGVRETVVGHCGGGNLRQFGRWSARAAAAPRPDINIGGIADRVKTPGLDARQGDISPPILPSLRITRKLVLDDALITVTAIGGHSVVVDV